VRFNCTLKSIQADSVTVMSDDREEEIGGFDQVVLAVGMRPRDKLKQSLEKSGIRHVIVGDALEVRRIIEATEEGARAAWDL
jgi:NADH dehydrogenase FAD-containing subunit